MSKPSRSGPAKSGGGANSRVVHNVAIKSGAPTTRAINPGAVSQIGIKQGNHAEGRTVQRPPQPIVAANRSQVPLGNEVAKNVGKGGVGAGRVVHPSGSQGHHGRK
jgi:hypothetical protein